MEQSFKTTNTILYCKKWQQTVAFYRDRLGLPVNFSNDWFVEFRLSEGARVSIADESRASIKSGGAGLTLSLEVKEEVNDIDSVRADIKSGVAPTEISDHPWGARVFYLYAPEGHRIEIRQKQ